MADVHSAPSHSSISVVVPVYNSASMLAELTARLDAALTPLVKSWEIIFVNDGSRDQSWEVIRGLAEQHPNVRGFNLMRNYGQHNALLTGIRHVRHELIVTIDDDLQHPPEEIPHMLTKLQEGHDVVYGSPQHEQHGFWRDFASQITKLALQNTMGVDIARHESSFRIFRSRVCEAFLHYNGPFISLDVLLTWGTNRFAFVRVRHDQRRDGESNYTFGKLLTHALNMTTGFSTMPLQIASWVGFAFTLFGVAVLIYVVGRYWLEGGSVPGFSFIASVIALFSGAQLFALGIIGEYLARMHFRSMGRPASVIRDVVGRAREHDAPHHAPAARVNGALTHATTSAPPLAHQTTNP